VNFLHYISLPWEYLLNLPTIVLGITRIMCYYFDYKVPVAREEDEDYEYLVGVSPTVDIGARYAFVIVENSSR